MSLQNYLLSARCGQSRDLDSPFRRFFAEAVGEKLRNSSAVVKHLARNVAATY